MAVTLTTNFRPKHIFSQSCNGCLYLVLIRLIFFRFTTANTIAIMFVTVYLVDAKKHTVVPEEFIYDLHKINLCNYGCNQNQNRRIYFSKDVFDSLCREENRLLLEPKFGLGLINKYPMPNDMQETCYRARINKFWGEWLNWKLTIAKNFFWKIRKVCNYFLFQWNRLVCWCFESCE